MNFVLVLLCDRLDGIMLSYENVNFATDYGKIKDDMPYIFWDVSADFYLFDPQIGSMLKGKIIR